MTLPTSGPLSFSQIVTLCRGANSAIKFTDEDVRYLLGDDGKRVKLSDAYGKPVAGSSAYISPGTYSFLIPPYSTLNVDVRGAGGGGGGGDNHNIYGYGNCGYDGGPGGDSRFGDVYAYGGGGGSGNCGSGAGAPGGGSGGTVTTGGGGYAGNGGWPQQGSGNGYNGGRGGKTVASFVHPVTSGYPVWKTVATVVVGRGGDAAPQNASGGQNGAVYVSWI